MRVYQRACASTLATEVIVATDHIKIFDHVVSCGGRAVMTSPDHQSGTDRIAEVAAILTSDIIINLQGDEPLIHPAQIDELISLMQRPEVAIGTQCQKINDPDILFDYNVVKVVRTYHDKALYFSRQVLPAVRDKGYDQWYSSTDYYRHIGMYGFKKDILLKITDLPESSYEKAESLEQLRWLQNGFEIYCEETGHSSIGVDTPEDLEAVRDYIFKEMFR
jgi:3-deoxy-manno-octulosonate cytidylyltransferase (CMP-KDO synthetase)